MKILIDRNIEIRAMTHVTEMAPKVTKWGPHYVTVDVAQRVHLAPKEKDTFGREQLPYLATLCNSANQGKLEFFTSFELRMEGVRQKGRSEGCMGIDMLRDVPLKNVPSPLQRSILIGATGTTSIGVTEEEQMTFFQSIQHPRFLQLRKAIGDAHIDDIFHLWTAEVASLDVFLTIGVFGMS
jgi:hypothetical protein